MAFPTVVSRDVYLLDPDAASHVVPYPAHTAGQLLLIVAGLDSTAAWNVTGSFAVMTSQSGGSSRMYLWAWSSTFGAAAGSVTLSTTGGALESGVVHVFLIDGAYDHSTESNVVAYLTTGGTSTANLDLGTLTPAWGAKDYLWITGLELASTGTVSAAPSGYSDLLQSNHPGTQDFPSLSTAYKTANAASENPGAWTHPSGNAAAIIIAIRPIDTFQQVSPTGIASAEAFGTASVQATVSPAGISSLEAFGTAQLTASINPTGIASLEAFGSHSITAGAVSISPDGIASLEAFGDHTVIAVQLVLANGIDSLEAFGSHSITAGAVNISPDGIASAEAFGALAIGSILTPTGIASAEAFGTLSLTAYIPMGSIASAEAFGTATLQLKISPTGIASLEAFGTLQAKNVVNIYPVGIDSLEAFGTATLRAYISPTGIASLEAFGTAALQRTLLASGIASAEAFGTLSITAGSVTISPVGIGSEEAFGLTVILYALAGGKLPPPGVSPYSYGPRAGVASYRMRPPAGDRGSVLWLPPGVSR